MRATYYGLMKEVDDNLGRVFAHLDATDQWNDTLVILTCDHGEMLGDHHLLGKVGYFDQSFHIPLVIRAPEQSTNATRGSIVSRFTETIDFRVNASTARNAKFGQAAVKAITLDKATHLHPTSIPSVVYACSERTRDLIQPSLNPLSVYAQRVYDVGNREEMADYMEMMQAAALAR